VVAFELTAMG